MARGNGAAGEYDKRIRFERAVASENSFGEDEETGWEPLGGAVWAKVSYGTGEDRRDAAQEGASIFATFRVRKSAATAAVTERDRISFGRAWEISSIVPWGDRDLEFTAKARKAAP